jgi:hypothetical protein
MLAYQPEARPPEIQLLNMGEFGRRPDFMAELPALDVLPIVERVGEWYVLAEKTELKALDWSLEAEERRSLVVPVIGLSQDRNNDARTVYQVYKREYGSLTPKSKGALTIQNRGERFESPASNWLAFDPELARQLGWVMSPTGFFQWQTIDGSPRVRTVWWAFGGVQRTPPRDGQVGEGWLVLVSPAGLGAIISRLGASERLVEVERSVKREGERHTIKRSTRKAVEP